MKAGWLVFSEVWSMKRVIYKYVFLMIMVALLVIQAIHLASYGLAKPVAEPTKQYFQISVRLNDATQITR